MADFIANGCNLASSSVSRSVASLLGFPEDILRHVLDYCRPDDMLSLNTTCKDLNSKISGISSLWSKILEESCIHYENKSSSSSSRTAAALEFTASSSTAVSTSYKLDSKNGPIIYARWRREFQEFCNIYPRVMSWIKKLKELHNANIIKFSFDGTALEDLREQRHSLFGNDWNDSIAAFLLLHHFCSGEIQDYRTLPRQKIISFFGSFNTYSDATSYLWALKTSGEGKYKRISHIFSTNIFAPMSHNRADHSAFLLLNSETRDRVIEGEAGQVALRFYREGSPRAAYVNFGSFIDFFESNLQKFELELEMIRHFDIEQIPFKFVQMHPISGQFYNRHITSIPNVADILVEVGTVPARTELRRGELLHSYQISIYLQHIDPSMPSVQLLSRYWRITYDGGEVEEVEGEGIIGAYPLLSFTSSATETSRGAFPTRSHSYSSYCQGEFNRQPIHMEGEFRFVKGTLDSPIRDEQFTVIVPRMTFRRYKPANNN